MIANKIACKIQQSLTFIHFLRGVLITFLFFVDTISITNIVSSHSVTEVLFKCLLMFTILTDTCAWISTKILFARTIIFTFTLTCFTVSLLI